MKSGRFVYRPGQFGYRRPATIFRAEPTAGYATPVRPLPAPQLSAAVPRWAVAA